MAKKLREQRREALREMITEDGRTRLAGVALAAKLLHVSEHTIAAWLKPETSASASETPPWALELLRYKLDDKRVSKAVPT